MRIKNKIKPLTSFIKVKLLGKKVPLAVRWQLTNRCVLKCKYCHIWDTPQQELSFEEILLILDQMAELGTQTISYSGGEPMLREDIFEILKETKKRKISTEMNSTGAFIAKNIAKLRDLDFLKLSLDGPQDVHDAVRGKGSYNMVIEAAESAKNNNLNFIFSTTLTKYNINYIDFIIEVAKKYRTFVAFQPLKSLYRGVENIDSLSPSTAEFKSAVKKLIELKKKNGDLIRNSLTGLYHILSWPKYPRLKCWAGKVFCIVETDATLLPCDRISYRSKLPNCREVSFKQALAQLPEINCTGCGFCGVLELNFLMALKINTIASLMKVIK